MVKFYRGATLHRPSSGFWNGLWFTNTLSQAILTPEKAIALDKQAWPTLTSTVARHKISASRLVLSPASLDSEGGYLAHVPTCLTPEPYEDLDQAFIHQK